MEEVQAKLNAEVQQSCRLEEELHSANQELAQVKNDRDKYREKYKWYKAQNKDNEEKISRLTEQVELALELNQRYKDLLERRQRVIEELTAQLAD